MKPLSLGGHRTSVPQLVPDRVADVVVGKGTSRKIKSDRRRLAGIKRYLLERLQLAYRPNNLRIQRLDVHLHDLRTVPITGIGHINFNLDRATCGGTTPRHNARLRHRKSRIRQTKPEFHRWFKSQSVVETVTHEQTLAIANNRIVTRIVQVSTEMLVTSPDSGRCPPARLNLAEQHVDDGIAEFLTSKTN